MRMHIIIIIIIIIIISIMFIITAIIVVIGIITILAFLFLSLSLSLSLSYSPCCVQRLRGVMAHFISFHLFSISLSIKSNTHYAINSRKKIQRKDHQTGVEQQKNTLKRRENEKKH